VLYILLFNNLIKNIFPQTNWFTNGNPKVFQLLEAHPDLNMSIDTYKHQLFVREAYYSQFGDFLIRIISMFQVLRIVLLCGIHSFCICLKVNYITEFHLHSFVHWIIFI